MQKKKKRKNEKKKTRRAFPQNLIEQNVLERYNLVFARRIKTWLLVSMQFPCWYVTC